MSYPSSAFYPSDSTYLGPVESARAKLIRELPPLRLHIEAITPSGRYYRWGSDEPNAENIFSGLRFSSTIPGGFESMDCVLPRKPGVDYKDLERLSTIRVIGPGGDVAWEGRLERTPQTSGEQMTITASCVGWQAHLEDNKDAKEIYVDRDLSHWGGPSVQRKIDVIAGNFVASDPSVVPDDAPGQASLETSFRDTWGATTLPSAEASYLSRGIPIGSLYYAWKRNSWVSSGADPNFTWATYLSDDDLYSAVNASGDLQAAGPGTGTLTATTTTRRVAAAHHGYGIAGGSANAFYAIWWTCLAVYGTHGLTKRGTATATSAQGFYASDVITHAVTKFAPLLKIGTIQATDFIIPHLVFLESTTGGEIVRQSNRFHLYDWAVWEDKKFSYYKRGAVGRKWRARIAPAQLEETGSQVDRLWESVIVQYQDVDGSTKTVGPPGSGADTETADLKDSDVDNPANVLGITRREKLVMGVGTAASATEVGKRFMAEQKLLDRSGRATLVGHVTDDKGILHPAWRVRAGDTIVFVDAADTSERRIIKADYDHASRTTSIDLDAPPEGLDAVLERLGVVLVGLGV